MKNFAALLLVICLSQSLYAGNIRVVSAVPSQTELLCAMGFKKNIVAISDYCNFPKEIMALPRVGALELNVEKIISLKPSVIVDVNNMHRRYEQIFRKVGINYVNFEITKISQIPQMAIELALILQEPQKGENFAKAFNASLEQIRLSRPQKNRRLYVEIWNNPLQAVGPNSFMGDFIREAGGENIILSNEEYPLVNPETIIKANPDIIIVCYPANDLDKVSLRAGFNNLKAVRLNRIYKVDQDIFVRPGPRNIEALQLLSGIVNDKGFR